MFSQIIENYRRPILYVRSFSNHQYMIGTHVLGRIMHKAYQCKVLVKSKKCLDIQTLVYK